MTTSELTRLDKAQAALGAGSRRETIQMLLDLYDGEKLDVITLHFKDLYNRGLKISQIRSFRLLHGFLTHVLDGDYKYEDNVRASNDQQPPIL